jgi:thiamine biosynthesis lipoprotein
MSPYTTRTLRSLACLPFAASAAAHGAPLDLNLQDALHDVAWTFHHENILGSSMQLTLRAATHSASELAEAAVLSSIDRRNLLLSAWRSDSELTRWLSTRNRPIAVPPELLDVLALFDLWRERTAGALNPAAEAAARLWQSALAVGRQPIASELAQAIAEVQQTHWRLDPANRTATHLTPTPITLASFTKSYIADRAANAALSAGATGVMLNIGGDIVVRGDLAQTVAIANPLADSENDAPIDRVLLRDRAIATSGSYRRGISLASDARQPEFSHIFDPRTAQPTGHIVSSSVIAKDAATAGALATAFSVLTPDESRSLAQSTPGIDYLLFTRDRERIASDGWQSYQAPTPRPTYRPAAYTEPRPPQAAKPGASWNPNFDLVINLEIAPAGDSYRYRRPYVAVWVEDENHFPVRTIALWYGKYRWLSDLRYWYRDDQVRTRAEGGDITNTVSAATRPPGRYTLKWDGTDNHGKPVKAGKYTIMVEASREHGGYDIFHQEMDFNGQPAQHTFPAGNELGAVTLDYRKQ